jgi:hypothetical protein
LPPVDLRLERRIVGGARLDRTVRFPVFHNRANQPLQHRLVNQTVAKNFALGVRGLEHEVDVLNVPTMGTEMTRAGVVDVAKLGEIAFGDPLRDFRPAKSCRSSPSVLRTR